MVLNNKIVAERGVTYNNLTPNIPIEVFNY